MTKTYKKIKSSNGSEFANALRTHCPQAFVLDDLPEILKHAGRCPDDAKALSPSLLELYHEKVQDNGETKPKEEPRCPFELLKDAGYDAYHADTQEKQDAIKKYFASGEALCTFGTSRYKDYVVINAVHKDVDKLKRSDFNGKEKRQDAYGASVISIQFKNGFISIKNRYNHKVPNCDCTFGNNPDNIIEGLTAALQKRFGVSFKAAKSSLPDKFIMCGDRFFKYHIEINGKYYGNDAVLDNGSIVEMNKDYERLYAYFVFDVKSKTLRLYDKTVNDAFPDDFNRHYGGNKNLKINKKGALWCDEDGDTFYMGAVPRE
jgi:hypothetical protein